MGSRARPHRPSRTDVTAAHPSGDCPRTGLGRACPSVNLVCRCFHRASDAFRPLIWVHGPVAALDVSRLRRLACDNARSRTPRGLSRPRRRMPLPHATLAGGRTARPTRPRSLPDAEPLPPRRPVPPRSPLESAPPSQRRLRRGLQREVHAQRPPLGRPLRAVAGARRRASARDLRVRAGQSGSRRTL